MPVRNTRKSVEVAVQMPPSIRITRMALEVARVAVTSNVHHGRRISLSFGRSKGN